VSADLHGDGDWELRPVPYFDRTTTEIMTQHTHQSGDTDLYTTLSQSPLPRTRGPAHSKVG
jgi:hypothetical protein